MWNRAVYKLGTVTTSNYLYFVPLVTFISAALVLGEPVTCMALCGAVLILTGIYAAQHRKAARDPDQKK